MSKDELEMFLPNDIIPIHALQNHGFSIRNNKVILHGWTKSNLHMDANII
jgi:hypothetical protein